MESSINRNFDADLQATCASLGYTDENGNYQREPDCLESVKDLIRFMKRDDELCHIRRQIGSAAILQTDLIPILKQIGNFFIEIQNDENELKGKERVAREKKVEEERVLLETVIRLVVNLTQPARLCFGDKVPDKLDARQSFIEIESYLQRYKEAFVDEALFSVLSQKLGTLLNLDWESRQEEDRLLIERILLLVRNILQVPPDVKSELRTDDDASLHDQILWSLHVSGFNDLLLYLANSGEERHLILHVVEILSLMLREQTPDQLASCGVARANSEKEKDRKELEEMLDMEMQKRKMSVLRAGSRHSTFGGTYRLENIKSISERDVIVHRTPTMKMDVHNSKDRRANVDASQSGKSFVGMFGVDLNKRKTGKRKPKNRIPVSETESLRRSTFAVRSMLKEFCVQFLESCYNPVMRAVKDALIRSKAQENDESYYLRLLTFMMQFNRKHDFKPALISETLSTPTFHYVTTQLERCYDLTQTEKKDAVMWSKRMHLALKSFHELLECVAKMDQSSDTQIKESSRVIKSNVFYTMEYRDILLLLVKKYDNMKQSKLFLRDLLETNHLFMRMLEQFCHNNKNLVVQRKKKKLVRRKSKPKKDPEESIATTLSGENLWDEVSEEVSQMLQGHREVPKDVMPFDAASDVDIDQQGVEAVRTIHECLKTNKLGEAIALFRSAREVWPEKVEFKISSDAPEDEFLALREICLLNFPESIDDVLVKEEETGSEEEESAAIYEDMEQSFSYQEFIFRYASPLVVKSCVAFLEDFKINSSSSNHCALKLLHRIGFDCGAVAILFQLSLFNVFRKLFSDPACSTAKQYAELKTFAIHVTRKFTEMANSDKKVIIEMLFWKSVKEAMDMTGEEGRKNMPDSKNKNGWSEQQDEELKYLFEEIKTSEADPPGDKKSYQPDIVDRIMARMSDQSKTRRQVLRQMVQLGLISSAAEVKNKLRRTRGWTEEELNYLKEIVPLSLEGQDPMNEIMTSYKNIYGGLKSRTTLRKKIIELGLSEKVSLKKKSKGKKKRDKTNKYEENDGKLKGNPSDDSDDAREEENDDDDTQNDDSSDEHGDSSSDDEVNSETVSNDSQALDKDLIKKLKNEVETKGFLLAIPWIKTKLEIVARDRDEEESMSMPLVPITEDQDNAMVDETFVSFLLSCGFKKPSSEQEQFWRIPSNLSSRHLREIANILSEESPREVVASASQNDDGGKKDVDATRKKVVRRVVDKFSDSEEEENESNIIDDKVDSDDEKLIIDEGLIIDCDGDNNNVKGSKRKLDDFNSDDEDLQDNITQPAKKARRLLESDDEDIVQPKSSKIIDSDED